MKFKADVPSMEGLFGPSFPNTSAISKQCISAIKAAGCDYGILAIETPASWCFSAGLYGFKPGSNTGNYLKGGVDRCAADIWRFTLEYRLYRFGVRWNTCEIHFDLTKNQVGFGFDYDPKVDGLGSSADSAKHAAPGAVPVVAMQRDMSRMGRDANAGTSGITWL